MSIELHQKSNLHTRTLLALSSQREIFTTTVQTGQDGEPPVFFFRWDINTPLISSMTSIYSFYQQLLRNYQKPREIHPPLKYPYLRLFSDEEFQGYGEMKREGDEKAMPFAINELAEPMESMLLKVIRNDAPVIDWISISTPFFNACFDGGVLSYGKIRKAEIAGRENLASDILSIHAATASHEIPNIDRHRVITGLNEFFSDLAVLNRL